MALAAATVLHNNLGGGGGKNSDDPSGLCPGLTLSGDCVQAMGAAACPTQHARIRDLLPPWLAPARGPRRSFSTPELTARCCAPVFGNVTDVKTAQRVGDWVDLEVTNLTSYESSVKPFPGPLPLCAHRIPPA